jgi:hypothetical protein
MLDGLFESLDFPGRLSVDERAALNAELAKLPGFVHPFVPREIELRHMREAWERRQAERAARAALPWWRRLLA